MQNVKIIQHWVKQLVSNKDWNTNYSKISSYCYLAKHESKGVWMGYLIGLPEGETELPTRCQPCSKEELQTMDNYRVSSNIQPYSLKMHKVI